jgi:hypothetical protein
MSFKTIIIHEPKLKNIVGKKGFSSSVWPSMLGKMTQCAILHVSFHVQPSWPFNNNMLKGIIFHTHKITHHVVTSKINKCCLLHYT